MLTQLHFLKTLSSIMPKLHQLIAVQADSDAKNKALIDESAKVFSNKSDLFWGSVKTVKAFDQARSQEIDSTEYKERATTVPERLDYTFQSIADNLNLIAQIDATNAIARADLVIDGQVLLKDVPAVTLLALEREGKKWLELIRHSPTLPHGIAWEPAPQEGKNVFVTKHPVVNKKTEKVSTPVVLYAATKEHPAQVKENIINIPIADITETTYSGMISSADKAALLDRVEKIIRAAKEARTRANEAEVVPLKIGREIASFILQGPAS